MYLQIYPDRQFLLNLEHVGGVAYENEKLSIFLRSPMTMNGVTFTQFNVPQEDAAFIPLFNFFYGLPPGGPYGCPKADLIQLFWNKDKIWAAYNAFLAKQAGEAKQEKTLSSAEISQTSAEIATPPPVSSPIMAQYQQMLREEGEI